MGFPARNIWMLKKGTVRTAIWLLWRSLLTGRASAVTAGLTRKSAATGAPNMPIRVNYGHKSSGIQS